MAASTVYMQAFQEVVSIGQETDTVEAIAQQFCTTLSHRLLLLNGQQQPSGVVYLPKLLSYLLSHQPQQIPINQVQPNLIDPLPLGTAPPLLATEATTTDLVAQNANLSQLNRLKDEFLACVTHELRSPLTAVLGLSTLLKEQSIGPLNDRQLRYARLIYHSGQNLISIVNDMLDLTRLETHQLELQFSSVNIAQVCLNAFEQARQRHQPEGAALHNHRPTPRTRTPADTAEPDDLPTFSLEIAPGLDRIIADENRLRQVLVNLLSNALKFTQNSGRIGLKVNRWEGWIAFTVWDTGIGIPPEKQHLIFQKFQQLESPMTRQFAGTGLGLVLAKRLAYLHGGDITFTSEEHHGSQFTLLLPPEPAQSVPQNSLASVPPAPLRRSGNSSAPLASRLALVIDASPYNLEDLSTHLTDLGYRITVARSGPDALAKARQLVPRIIFLNPTLPLLSGWDVLTLLKASETTRDIPVVITASHLDQVHPQQRQADGCLSLPVLHQSLATTLAKLDGPIEPSPPSALHDPVVIVYLNPVGADLPHPQILEVDHLLLHQYNCRVLESDNLEQAELLAKVWQAQVVVLNPPATTPAVYLNELIQHPYLASLPLITLDAATTQAANHIASLAVFPCLIEWHHLQPLAHPLCLTPAVFTDNLLKAIEVAIGFAGHPLILATDVEQWQVAPPAQRHDWLNAFVQYMQTAGLRCSIGQSSMDILRTLQTHSVDLLLLHWHQPNSQPLQQALKNLKSLQKNHQISPAIILIHAGLIHVGEPSDAQTSRLDELLDALNVTCINANEPMDDLLRQIRCLLGIAN